MKKSTFLGKASNYLKELTIITIGVLIALFIGNYKDNNQAKDFQRASIVTINTEVEANYSSLKGIVEQRNNFLDTITNCSDDNISIIDLFKKVNGIQFATLNNTGLEFYSRCEMSLIDFELMSTLYKTKVLSELIRIKLERLSDFAYSNIQVDSKESKTILSLYVRDVLNTEYQLLKIYEHLTEETIATKNNS